MANNDVELWLSFDDELMHTLSIPVDDCKRFAQHPLKWLRFLGYCIYGTEGNISMSDKGPVVASYETDVQSSCCYFIPDGEYCYALDFTLQDLLPTLFCQGTPLY